MQPSMESVRPGMTVRDSDQRRLGHVTQCWDDYFEVEKGVFFEHIWMVPFSDVAQNPRHVVKLIRPGADEAEMLAGMIMRGYETPAKLAANNALQHWLSGRSH